MLQKVKELEKSPDKFGGLTKRFDPKKSLYFLAMTETFWTNVPGNDGYQCMKNQ